MRIATERSEDAGFTADIDRNVRPGVGYFYRLAWITEDGEPGTSEVVTATLPTPRGLSLAVLPNPASGPVQVEWSLPTAGSVELAVFDISGRQVAGLSHRQLGAGSHRWVWDGRTGSGPAAPGLYLVRLRHVGQEVTQRLLLRR